MKRLALCLLCLASLAARAEKIALTFDDLPLNGDLNSTMSRVQLVRQVQAVFKAEHLPKVMGFINAKKADESPDGAEALKLWVQGGEAVGNHSYSHINLNEVSAEQFLNDVWRNEASLSALEPKGGWHWFRYPYLNEGDTLERRRVVRRALTDHGYKIAEVTLDYEDYLWNSPYARCLAKKDQAALDWLHSSYLEIASRYIDLDRQMAQQVFGRPISHVLLLHLGAYSPVILPELFKLLKDKGFSFATWQEVQQDPIYKTDPDVALKDGGSLTEHWMEKKKIPYPKVEVKPYKKFETLCQ